MNTYALIKYAIEQKMQVKANYNGCYRELCPHVIGRRNARGQGLFYQFGGTSRRGLDQPGSGGNWRCIPITGLSDVRIALGDWHTAPNHTRPQTCVEVVDVEVEQ